MVSTIFLLLLAGSLRAVGQVLPPAAGQKTAAERLRGPAPSEIQAKIEAKKKALEDDPVASLRRMLALPPNTQQAAQFFGNLTALNATPGNAFMMARQTNCSLTAFNTGYTLSSNSATYNAASTTPNFEQQIHAAAGLTTTADQFQNGCASSGVGVVSNTLIYVGKTSSGVRVGALTIYNGSSQHNAIYLLVTKADGTLVDTPTLPDPSSGATNPVGLLAADINKRV
jgi:hypothetical protein